MPDSVNNLYERVQIVAVPMFLVFSVVLLVYVWRNRSANSTILYLIPCALWVALGNIAHLYVYELHPLDNRWVPLGVHLFKDLSGYVAVVVSSFVCAQRIDVASPHGPRWVPRALELSWLTFPLFFAAAVAVGLAATLIQTAAPTNLEMSGRVLAGVYRFLIVAPIIAYSVLISYWFLRLFGVGPQALKLSVRSRIMLSTATYGFIVVWGFAYLAWPFSAPNPATSAVQQAALGLALVTGSLSMLPPLKQSTNDRKIKRFENDEPVYTRTSLAVEGVYDQGYIERWMSITTLIGEMAHLSGNRVGEWQLRAAGLAVFVLVSGKHGRAGSDGSVPTSFPMPEPDADLASSVESYNIPADHPLKDEIEADLTVQRQARYAARLLNRPEPGEWLRREPEWIQILAIAAVDGGVMPKSWTTVVHPREKPLISDELFERYDGLRYLRENRRLQDT